MTGSFFRLMAKSPTNSHICRQVQLIDAVNISLQLVPPEVQLACPKAAFVQNWLSVHGGRRYNGPQEVLV